MRMQIVIDYLNQYPLLSTKRHDFNSFKEAFNLIQSGQHLTLEGKAKILSIKNAMNNKRINFD